MQGIYQTVVLEVDEFQHRNKTYNIECEQTRMRQIYMDNGCSHIVFLRFNPDHYYDSNNHFLKTSLKRRYGDLIKYLKRFLSEEPTDDNNIKVVYLFYDGYSPSNPLIQIVDPYLQS